MQTQNLTNNKRSRLDSSPFNFINTIRILCITLLGFCNFTLAALPGNELINGLQLADTSGLPIQAHGGGVIKVGAYYYWFGENRQPDNHFLSVSCYRSSDMVNWTKVSDALTKDSSPDLASVWIERPKVIYNALTNKYVMWMHWENGVHYGEAKAAVAWSNSVDGPYTYVRSFRPYEDRGVYDGWEQKPGYMSRDSTLFLDDDGKGYFVTSGNDNKDLRIFRLTSDFLDVDQLVGTPSDGQSRESPALFKRNGVYFLLTSGTSGWSPNQQKYATSTSLSSGWSWMQNVGDFWTFGSQTAYVLTVQTVGGSNAYLYMGDRWGGAWGASVNESGYVWAPISFPNDTTMEMSWNNTVSIFLNDTNPFVGTNKFFRLKNKKSGLYLDVNLASTTDGAAIVQRPISATISQKWDLQYKGRGDFYLSNIKSGKAAEVPGWSTTVGTNLDQWPTNDGNNQRWHIIDRGNGEYSLWNSHSLQYMQVEGGSTKSGAAIEQGNYSATNLSQRWIIETVQ